VWGGLARLSPSALETVFTVWLQSEVLAEVEATTIGDKDLRGSKRRESRLPALQVVTAAAQGLGIVLVEIENRVLWVLDMTYSEDRNHARKIALPLRKLRCLAVNVSCHRALATFLMDTGLLLPALTELFARLGGFEN
jgi:hypothetical protein